MLHVQLLATRSFRGHTKTFPQQQQLGPLLYLTAITASKKKGQRWSEMDLLIDKIFPRICQTSPFVQNIVHCFLHTIRAICVLPPWIKRLFELWWIWEQEKGLSRPSFSLRRLRISSLSSLTLTLFLLLGTKSHFLFLLPSRGEAKGLGEKGKKSYDLLGRRKRGETFKASSFFIRYYMLGYCATQCVHLVCL